MDTDPAPQTLVPNHHAGHPGFTGLRGFLGALSMAFGRADRARVAIDRIRLTPSDRLVDIGCGPGQPSRMAARTGARATGVDPAPIMLRAARLLAILTPRTTYRLGGAEALPLADHSATAAWSLASVHHWPDLDRGLAEAQRVLVPGGRFLALERRVEPGGRGLASHGWTDAQAAAFVDHCRRANFVSVEHAIARAGADEVHTVLARTPPG